MRKLIVIVAALLAPIAMWTAGCRQDSRQSAFPKGPEVKGLSRAPMEVAQARPEPKIAAVIDPEVLSTPDQPTFARIRAVMDREAQLSSRYSEPGLFVLPQQDHVEMAYIPSSIPGPGYEPLPEPTVTPAPVQAPIQTPGLAFMPQPAPATNFWSTPATALPPPHPGAPMPADISAMAPPAAFTDNFDPVMLPEDIPGVYLGTDADPGEAPGGFNLFGSAARQSEPVWRGGTSALPPPLSGDEFTTITAEELNVAMREAGGFLPPAAFDRDADFALAGAAAPTAPTARPDVREKIAALIDRSDVREALSPLPDLAAPAPAPIETPIAVEKPAAATSVPGTILPLPSLDAASAPTLKAAPSLFPEDARSRDTRQRDVYLTDFWQNRVPATTAPTAANDAHLPKSILDYEFSAPSVEPEAPMPEIAAPVDMPAGTSIPPLPIPAPTQTGKGDAAFAANPAPTRVPMRPIFHKSPARSNITDIDAAIEAPPMKF